MGPRHSAVQLPTSPRSAKEPVSFSPDGRELNRAVAWTHRSPPLSHPAETFTHSNRTRKHPPSFLQFQLTPGHAQLAAHLQFLPKLTTGDLAPEQRPVPRQGALHFVRRFLHKLHPERP